MSLPGESGLRATESEETDLQGPACLWVQGKALLATSAAASAPVQSHPQAYLCEARGNAKYPGLDESASCV